MFKPDRRLLSLSCLVAVVSSQTTAKWLTTPANFEGFWIANAASAVPITCGSQQVFSTTGTIGGCCAATCKFNIACNKRILTNIYGSTGKCRDDQADCATMTVYPSFPTASKSWVVIGCATYWPFSTVFREIVSVEKTTRTLTSLQVSVVTSTAPPTIPPIPPIPASFNTPEISTPPGSFDLPEETSAHPTSFVSSKTAARSPLSVTDKPTAPPTAEPAAGSTSSPNSYRLIVAAVVGSVIAAAAIGALGFWLKRHWGKRKKIQARDSWSTLADVLPKFPEPGQLSGSFRMQELADHGARKSENPHELACSPVVR